MTTETGQIPEIQSGFSFTPGQEHEGPYVAPDDMFIPGLMEDDPQPVAVSEAVVPEAVEESAESDTYDFSELSDFSEAELQELKKDALKRLPSIGPNNTKNHSELVALIRTINNMLAKKSL